MNKTEGYDLIGDIHGHAAPLIELLEKLGYEHRDGSYRHPHRQVIFLGDYIDRGPSQREVLQVVMEMVREGAALAVMGNHELNALAFHTEDPENPGVWMRPRLNKNVKQHLAFLDEYLGNRNKSDLDEVLAFFYSLPLWLDLDGLRVVHACWEPNLIEALKPKMQVGNTLNRELLIKASRKGTLEYEAVEALLKGIERQIPNGGYFHDKDGTKRDEARMKWWHSTEAPLKEIAFVPRDLDEDVANIVFSANDLVGYPSTEKPVFIGHYWLSGHPQKLADNVACLDYSVAGGGKLVAYRWSGEQRLDDTNFVFVSNE